MSELVLHAVAVGLAQLALAAVEDVAGQVVAAFLKVAHALDVASVRLVVDLGQHMEGLEDTSVVGLGVAELGRVAALLEHPDNVMRADGSGVDGSDHSEDVGPVVTDPLQADVAAGRRVERAVAGGLGVRKVSHEERSADGRDESVSPHGPSPYGDGSAGRRPTRRGPAAFRAAS